MTPIQAQAPSERHRLWREARACRNTQRRMNADPGLNMVRFDVVIFLYLFTAELKPWQRGFSLKSHWG